MAIDETLPLETRPREICLDGFALTVTEGPGAGASLKARVSEISVGSAPGNDLVLADPTVSRHHFSVRATAQGFLLRDLDSSNGTWVGAVRIREGHVEPGARLKVGRTTLRIDRSGEDILEPLSADDRFGSLLGTSSAMRRIFAALPRVAKSESTVLVEGETGTGKGVLAAAIHATSARAARPFVVLDCTAIPPTLVESELFGHVKGAFTGAASDRAGAFEQAHLGTIFIDEIGELPLEMQPKLLRALEERSVKPVGGNKRVNIDVRVLAATNRDLRTEVNRGSFRPDLYYRLNVVRLLVPPLRERTGDIEQLARHFYAELVQDRELPDQLLSSLRHQPWPGNVRELRAAVERAILLDDPVLTALANGPSPREEADAAGDLDPDVPFRVAKQRAADRWEQRYVRALLAQTQGNLSEAARRARMDRSYLRSLQRKYGLRGQDDDSGS
jgi:transcriptional regulator with GAF, ATPase, and Fis domain